MSTAVWVRRASWVACVGFLACGPGNLAISAETTQPGGHRALLIGINDYSASAGTDSGKARQRGLRNLEGPVNDVRALREILVGRYGFASRDILTLTDKEATREAILQAVDEHLIRRSEKGDVVLFYFAGHGSQVANPQSDEPDGLDESLVPADSRQGTPDIRDKELQRLLNRVLDREVHLTVVLDSCNSGSGVRGLFTGTLSRSIQPDLDGVRDGAPTGPRPEDRGALVLSAAQDFARAWETRDENQQPRGAFSLALSRAMLDATADEPAEETFARARARLQAEKRFQQPVLAGTAAARRTPLLGSSAERSVQRSVLAVESVEEDGTVLLQGGWAQGLTVGSELHLAASGSSPGLRLRVTAIDDPSRCRARIVSPLQRSSRASSRATVKPGMLAEVVRWVSLSDAPLRVWVPRASGTGEALSQLAQELAREAPRHGVSWIDDPTEKTPDRILRWRGQGWEILHRTEEAESLGPVVDARALLARLAAQPGSLFVQLPSPTALVEEITLGPGTAHSGVEITDRPEEANYVLVGRLAEKSLEYAFLRSDTGQEDRRWAALPVRTQWQPLSAARETALSLEDAILRLRKIHAWHSLKSPSEGAFAYELAVRREGTGELVGADGVLVGQQKYGLVLRSRTATSPADAAPRYVYVFVIDSFGKSVLLFPVSGSVENLFPVQSSTGQLAPAEIPLGLRASFRVTPPYGVDSYFLLTTDEPLPNPWILQWDGVRTRGPRGGTPLEELLSITGGTLRSSPVFVPSTWSMETKVLESTPPAGVVWRH